MSWIELNKIKLITATLSLVLNVFYFLPISFLIIMSGGGPFGFGSLILFITIPLNILIIPAVYSFIPKWKNSQGLAYLNFFGLIALILCFGYSCF